MLHSVTGNEVLEAAGAAAFNPYDWAHPFLNNVGDGLGTSVAGPSSRRLPGPAGTAPESAAVVAGAGLGLPGAAGLVDSSARDRIGNDLESDAQLESARDDDDIDFELSEPPAVDRRASSGVQGQASSEGGSAGGSTFAAPGLQQQAAQQRPSQGAEDYVTLSRAQLGTIMAMARQYAMSTFPAVGGVPSSGAGALGMAGPFGALFGSPGGADATPSPMENSRWPSTTPRPIMGVPSATTAECKASAAALKNALSLFTALRFVCPQHTDYVSTASRWPAAQALVNGLIEEAVAGNHKLDLAHQWRAHRTAVRGYETCATNLCAT